MSLYSLAGIDPIVSQDSELEEQLAALIWLDRQSLVNAPNILEYFETAVAQRISRLIQALKVLPSDFAKELCIERVYASKNNFNQFHQL